MAIKSIFDASSYEQIKKRIENLQPNAVRLWGKLDAAQMLHRRSRLLRLGGSGRCARAGN